MKRIHVPMGWCALLIITLFTACKKSDKEADNLSTYKTELNVIYSTAQNFSGKQQQLGMDVYVPQNGRTDNPLVLVLHGGGYYSGTRDELAEFCQFFAQRNFTAVTMSYRLGWEVGNGSDFCGGDAYSVIQAGYRATQDLHAALRYLVTQSNRFHIDTSKIFIGGASAGSVTALMAAFVSQGEFNEAFPQLENQLGPLKARGNSVANKYQVKGLLNMWGGIINPAVIGPEDNIPVISFHGSSDPVVPYEKGNFANCTQYPEFYGSKAIYDVLTAAGKSAVLHTENNGGHGVYNLQYLAQNSYCFLKQVIEGKKPTGSFTNSISSCP
jgi:poly(3-hydroxybutyrate) depolymerase